MNFVENENAKDQANSPTDRDLGQIAFEAMEIAAAFFSSDLLLCTTNAAWRSRVGDDAHTHAPGTSAKDIFETLTDPERANPVKSHTAMDLLGLVRSCVRDYELPRAVGDPLLFTSNPVKAGGFVVTLRDPDRGRILEESALALLRDSIESLDMGMMVWDAGLIVRTANEAWNRHIVPMSPHESTETFRSRLAERGVIGPNNHTGDPQSFASFIIESHRHPRRWTLTEEDGRLLRLSTFPTKSGGVLAVAHDVTERQDVEATAERLFADALRSLGDGVLLLDGDLRCLISNAAFLKLIHDPSQPPKRGISIAELLSKPVSNGQYKPRDGRSLEEEARAFEDDIINCRENVRMDLTDGRILERSAFRTAMGGYVLILRDVTERTQAQDRLQQSEELTRKLVEELGVGVSLYDADMRLQINNAAFRSMMYQDLPISAPGMHVLEEIRGTIAAGVLPLPPGLEEAGSEMLEQAVLAAMAAEEKGKEVIRSDGTILEASMSATADGGYISVLHDVTDRKSAEHAAREADDLLRTIIENSPTTFLVTRFDDGKVIYSANPSRDRFGDIQTARSFFLDPKDRETYLAALSETGTLTDYPVRFRRRDGSIMDGLTSARIIEYKGQRLIVSSTRDISEQLALQRELERQRELAHQNEKLSAMGGLLAGVAHELNNPLSIIVANALMLEEDIQEPALQRRVSRLSSAAQRSGKIIKSFLAMARNRPMRTELAHLNEIIETALEISSYGLRSQGAEIELHLDDHDPELEVDADQIIQLLSNLVVNAEHAMADQGADARLTISTRHRGGEVEIEVADSGPGVPDDLRRRVFEPYFTTKEIGKGTGIGLAFCHRVVRNHGGSIELMPNRGTGAVFRVTLPLQLSSEDAEEAAVSQNEKTPAKILLLDDEEDVAETMADILRREGYEVDTFLDARAALKACQDTAYDAVLSDIRMPGMDGLAFFEALRKVTPRLAKRLVFLTGDAMGQDRQSDLAATAQPTLEKPADPAEIARALESVMKEAQTDE